MISSVGSSAASQLLSTLLSKLASASSASSATSSSSQSTATSAVSAFQQAIPGESCKGSSSAVSPLSGDVLQALIALQAQQDGGASATTAGTNSPDPVQQLFSAMDSDGDGEVSQSEMESYIEGVGGTQAQADALFTSLDQDTSSGVTESDMANALSQAQQSHQAWRGHHHHHGMDGQSDQADQVSNTLLQALDSNDDGSVSADEFTSFMTANGVSSTDAQNDFTALDTTGTGSLTSADFAKAWQAYTSQSSGNILASFLGAMAQTGSTTSVSA